MYQEQVLQTNLDELSRCEERRRMPDDGKSLSPIQKTDAILEEIIKPGSFYIQNGIAGNE